MAELATLARPYAHAVFDIAKAGARLEAWSRALGLLAAAVDAPQVRELLGNPQQSSEQKARVLIDLCRAELDDRGRRFVQVLARNKRLQLLPEIRDAFEVLRAEQQKVLDVEVISAHALNDAERDQLLGALASRFDREIQLTTQVDSSLIGGAVVRAGDTVIDGSVRGKLQKLSEALLRV